MQQRKFINEMMSFQLVTEMVTAHNTRIYNALKQFWGCAVIEISKAVILTILCEVHIRYNKGKDMP